MTRDGHLLAGTTWLSCGSGSDMACRICGGRHCRFVWSLLTISMRAGNGVPGLMPFLTAYQAVNSYMRSTAPPAEHTLKKSEMVLL